MNSNEAENRMLLQVGRHIRDLSYTRRMTSELRTLIELEDIAGVEIECPGCHVKIVFPMTQLFKIGIGCTHCPQQWFDSKDEPGRKVYPALEKIQQIIAHLRALTNGDRTDIHAKVRVQIKNAS